MKISPDWTPEERLAVIGQLAAQVLKQPRRSGFVQKSLLIAENIVFIASKSAHFLEANRRNIEADLGEPS